MASMKRDAMADIGLTPVDMVNVLLTPVDAIDVGLSGVIPTWLNWRNSFVGWIDDHLSNQPELMAIAHDYVSEVDHADGWREYDSYDAIMADCMLYVMGSPK